MAARSFPTLLALLLPGASALVLKTAPADGTLAINEEVTCVKLGGKMPANSKPVQFGAEKKDFPSGTLVPLECAHGFAVAEKGKDSFDATCTDGGYWKFAGTCVEESKCGQLPMIANATPTGEVLKRVGMPDQFEYKCNKGYSLDGNPTVEGGFEPKFSLKCKFEGRYSEFEGKCQSFGFMPATKIIAGYNKVFEVLWQLECKNALVYRKGDELPPGLDTICSTNEALKKDSATCSELVGKVKENMKGKCDTPNCEAKFDDSQKTAAKDFCAELWKLHEIVGAPEDAAAPAADAATAGAAADGTF